MFPRLRVAITAFLLLLFVATWSAGSTTQVPWEDHPVREYYYLLFADLVVQGTVLDARTKMVPWREADNDSDYVHFHIKALFVTLAVEDVLSGGETPDTLVFTVAEYGNAPVLSGSVGRRIVVGLTATSDAPRVTYEMVSEEGLYLYDGSSWILQGGVKAGRSHTLDELQTRIETVSLKTLSQSADAVFFGTVEGVEESRHWEDSDRIYGLIKKITLRVNDRILGDVPDQVAISGVAAGFYWPAWRYKMPSRILPGDTFCVFAKEMNGIIIALGGENGFLLIDEKRVLYDNRVTLPFGPSELAERIKSYAGEED